MNSTLNYDNKKILSILIFIFFSVISSILTFSLATVIMQLLLTLITLPFLVNKNRKKINIYLVIFIISIISVFLVYIANNAAYGSPYYIGGSDDLTFETKGKIISIAGIYNPSIIKGTIIDRFDNAPFFGIYMALLFDFSELFGGYNTFLPRIINVYFLIWICLILEYLLSKYSKLSDDKINIIIIAFALMPNIQYINSHVFRDTFNLLQMFIIVYLIENIIDNNKLLKKIIYIPMLIMLIYITYYTRKNSIIFAMLISILVVFEKYKINYIYLFLICIILIFSTNFIDFIDLEYFISSYGEYNLGLAGTGLSSHIFSQPLLPFGILLRIIYAFATPFPNFLGLFKNLDMIILDIVMLLIYVGVVLQILATPFIIKRIFKFDWIALSFLVLFIPIISTTFTFRHVLLYYPLMVTLAIEGFFETKKTYRYKIILISMAFGMSLGLIYLILKLF